MFKKILKLKFRFYEIWKNLFMLVNQISYFARKFVRKILVGAKR